MGLETVSSTSNTFVTIVRGLFTIRLPDGADDTRAVERTLEKGPNAGKTVKELQFNKLSGKVVSASIDKSDFGTNIMFNVEDGGDSYKLQIPVDSKFFGQIVKRLPNFNLDSDDTEFHMGYDSEHDKPFMYLRQDGVTVPMAYTKDNPNGMPKPVEKTVKGEKKLDFEKQENFLFDVATEFVGKFDGSTGAKDEYQDDVPF